MPPALSEYLKESSKANSRQEFVAPGPNGEMLSYHSLYSGLKTLCRLAGVKIVTPHELRHSCTELYVEAGASAEDIRRLLNQSSLSATARYMHRTDGRLSRIATLVGKLDFEPSPNGKPPLKLIS